MSSGSSWEFDDSGDELRDDEYPEEEYPDDDSQDGLSETVSCSQCGAEIYEDAVQCPICGSYVAPDTAVFSGKPGWWIVLGLLGALATVAMLVFGL